jgi:hypothetical protein
MLDLICQIIFLKLNNFIKKKNFLFFFKFKFKNSLIFSFYEFKKILNFLLLINSLKKAKN